MSRVAGVVEDERFALTVHPTPPSEQALASGSDRAHTGLQPALHELVTVLTAPTTVLSDAAGQIAASGAQGAFTADLRVLSQALLTVNGLPPEPVTFAVRDAAEVEFVSLLRRLGDRIPDPTVWLRRRRTARPDGVAESLVLSNVSGTDVAAAVALTVATDLAPIDRVKTGTVEPGDAVPFHLEAGGPLAAARGVSARLSAPQADIEIDSGTATLSWDVTIPARGEVQLGWSLAVTDKGAVLGPPIRPGFSAPHVTADDRRLSFVVDRSVGDLVGLAAALAGEQADTFFSAGSPWYLTLFGRDSLWSARMTLPLGTDVAAGTLRVLGRRQGTTVDPESAEEPGKILHELRRGTVDLHDIHLPPVYFGSIDATPLWICLLRDAWRWGMDPAEVDRQLDSAVRALEWLATHGDPDGDGFLEYLDSSGRGLTNQGWKDSGDSIRFVDGTIADGPVALAEVQGYAFEAALAGAELLDAFGRPGADRWRSYAAALAENFRQHFWLSDSLGAFPALALDGAKRQVDSPASNMGHLLGTGLLNQQEAAAVAARLVHPSMSSGFGLRTMSSTTGGYSPLSYHCGSVWPHDTAIAVHGLLREGFSAAAATLASGLLAAAATFDGRLPELYGGFDSVDVPVPVPYPASCRPQAWSAGAAVVMLQAFLGLEVDIPAAAVSLRPSAAVGAFAVDGLTIGGRPWRVAVDAAGVPTAAPLAGLDIRVSKQRG